MQPGLLRVQHNQELPAILCLSCARSAVAAHTLTALRPDLIEFFLALTHLSPSPVTPNAQRSTPKAQACPSCGLTYAEFESIGLAGCEHCYEVFQNVIRDVFREMASLQ